LLFFGSLGQSAGALLRAIHEAKRGFFAFRKLRDRISSQESRRRVGRALQLL
jgi:hypothetical protein